MPIDGRTLLEVAAVLSLLLGGLVLSLEWRLSQPIPGLRFWALAAFCVGAGSGLSTLRGLVDPWLPIGLGVPVLLAGRLLQLAALRRFDDRPGWGGPLCAAWAVGTAALLATHAAWPDGLARPLLVAGAGVLVNTLSAATVVTGGPASAGRTVVATSLGGLAAINLWRVAMVLRHDPPLTGTELQSPLVGLQIGTVLVLDVMANVGMILLISERIHDWVLRLSRQDHLTGALARGALITQASHELQRARRQRSPTAAVLVDIDWFKQINDTHGHLMGDRVLQHVAEQARRVLRCTDLFGRYGGDEFIAVLPDTDLLTAAAIAERLRIAVQAPAVDGPLPPLSLSLGAAALAPGEAGLAELIAQADGALYNAKRAGRNRVGVADGAHAPVHTSLRVLQGRR